MDAVGRWLGGMLRELFGTFRRAVTTIVVATILYLVIFPAVFHAVMQTIIVPLGCLAIVLLGFRIMLGGLFKK